MKGKYKVAFILPMEATRRLGPDRWEFESFNRISLKIKEFLIDALKIEFAERYLAIEKYIGKNVEMSVFYSDVHQIELIQFKLYENALDTLNEIFIAGSLGNGSELFLP